MKRSQMEQKILKILQDWENSAPSIKAAREILKLVEKNGMKPPDYKNVGDPTHKDERGSKIEANRYCCNFHYYYPDGRYLSAWEQE